MSGHSKWHSIKHKKGIADQKRGSLFTKLGNVITIAARQGGGDPEMNFGLRLAIEKAKQANMPKENIERAIKRGTGELSSQTSLEQVTYEGFGPCKVAIIIECLTDNKNRTVSEIKHILEKNGGSMTGPGSVMWQFKRKGVLEIRNQKLEINDNELELKIIDCGAEDIEKMADKTIIYTKPEELEKVKENLEKKSQELGIQIESAEIEFVAKNKVEADEDTEKKIEKMFETLDDQQDVSNYYVNLR